MRPRARILGLAAAWALAGSGCDYWRNLTEPKREAKVDLVLVLKDAWTGEALTAAGCSVDGSPVQSADGEGRISLPASPTGRKTVDCSSPSYHERSMTLDARPGQGRFDIPLARKGGEDWYPEDERRIRMEMKGGNLRFPGVLQMQGFPTDSTDGRFQYTWTSSHLAGQRVSPTVTVPVDSQSGETVEITVNLTVTANLAERTYEVGKESQTFTLVKNQPPTLKVLAFNQSTPLRVGSGCTPEKFADVHVTTEDPDGDGSCRLHLYSTDPSSPLGLIDTTAPCGQAQLFRFRIIQHDGAPDQSVPKYAILHLKATDGNGGTRDSLLRVETYSNLHPEITLDQIGGRERNLINDTLDFRIVAWDRDVKMVRVAWDWKDGISSYLDFGFVGRKDTLVEILSHVYKQAGTYEVEARVIDGCNVVDTAILSIEVVAE